MATIDYKQKIKDYMNSSEVDTLYKSMLNNLFPELKESEDERIRKELIQNLKERFGTHGSMGVMLDMPRVIAWLEKQGENHVVGNNEMVKPADKVKPKFHEGDWVVCDGWTTQIVAVYEDGYANSSQGFIPLTGEHSMRLWDVSKDAKDGDVLVASDGSIFLFAGVVDWGCKYYAALTTDGAVKLSEGLEHFWETSRAVHPATKEQRDLFFQKMHEAGYEWNVEKKEVMKIEQKLAWSDEVMFGYTLVMIEQYEGIYKEKVEPVSNWLKSLKERYTWKSSDEQIRVCKEVYADILSAKGFDIGTVNGELNRLEEQLKKLKG